MTSTICPICATVTGAMRTHEHVRTPYWVCPNCNVWFQDPAPPKLFHAANEPPPEQMPEADKKANEALAGWLVSLIIAPEQHRTVLDIGSSSYPYLARCFATLGCYPIAIDGDSNQAGWSNILDVPVYRGNFEVDPSNIRSDAVDFYPKNFQLITLIHTFEHFYRPAEALRKLRKYVADNGRVFIRSPDHSVPGYERDLTADHYSIHPFYHTLSSILQCCVEAEDCFEVESYTQMQPGQMNIVLRPIKEKPWIGVGMIVKNEERDLPRALASIRDAADWINVVDTGSTDRTLDIAAGYPRVTPGKYLDASKQDKSGDWQLQDFSAARNYTIKVTENIAREWPASDWYLWLDADDVLLTPAAIRRASYYAMYDAFGFWIEDNGSRWLSYRMWKIDKGVRFKGRCHEYPVIDGLSTATLDDVRIEHRGDASGGETSNARNLRILLDEWNENPTSARIVFYIANTYRDAGEYKEAARWYRIRIDAMATGFRDEWLFAWLYLIRCVRKLPDDHIVYDSNPDQTSAEVLASRALAHAPDWMEFKMELASIQFEHGRYHDAIESATPAIDAPIPPTVLWREESAYRDAPSRLISWCHEKLENYQEALAWAHDAKDRIGKPDAEWDARIERLKQVVEGKKHWSILTTHNERRQMHGLTPVELREEEVFNILNQKPIICIRRAGAIGDVLMTLNLLPALKVANPKCKVIYFTDPKLGGDDALGWMIRIAGADAVLPANEFEDWARSPRHKCYDLVGYPLAEGYPDKPMQLHLLQYFAQEMGLTRSDLPTMPALTLPRPQLSNPTLAGNYVTVQPKARWSKYKQWPMERWQEVYDALPDTQFFVFDESIGKPLRDVVAIFANARMHLGIDSFCNHLTNYYWTDAAGGRRVPGVILWGSTQVSASGYPHNTNISLDLPCQPCFREDPAISRNARLPCQNPPRQTYEDNTPWACTHDISVEQVVEAVRAMWNRKG